MKNHLSMLLKWRNVVLTTNKLPENVQFEGKEPLLIVAKNLEIKDIHHVATAFHLGIPEMRTF